MRWVIPSGMLVWSFFMPRAGTYTYVGFHLFLFAVMLVLESTRPEPNTSLWTDDEIDIRRKYCLALRDPAGALRMYWFLCRFQWGTDLLLFWMFWNYMWITGAIVIVIGFVTVPLSRRLSAFLGLPVAVYKAQKMIDKGDMYAERFMEKAMREWTTFLSVVEKLDGVAMDECKTAEWLRKAAKQGDAAAQLNLGISYASGDGVVKDLRKAAKWYRKAAEQGGAVAQYNLGYCYFFGTGVAKDGCEAVKWYRKAAEQGFVFAQHNLGYCYFFGTGVAKDEREAVKWYRKAARQGDVHAQYNLGECYQEGTGVAKDESEAMKWYRMAAEQGNENAKKALKVMGL
jgi:Sel1 repeat-containing protein